MSLTSYQAAPPRIFRIVSMLILRKSKNVCSSQSQVEKDNLICVHRCCDFVDGWRKDPLGKKKASKFSSERPAGLIRGLFSIVIPKEYARMSGFGCRRNRLHLAVLT